MSELVGELRHETKNLTSYEGDWHMFECERVKITTERRYPNDVLAEALKAAMEVLAKHE